MKCIEYYAGDTDLVESYAPVNHEAVKCILTDGMLRYIVQQHADSPPPFKLTIHREILWRVIEWKLPEGLFDLEINTADRGTQPLDKAMIKFGECFVTIYYRRMVHDNWFFNPFVCTQASSGYPA